MAYTRHNYPTKEAFLTDVKAGKTVEVFQPGPFGPDIKDGMVSIEGPHYPEPHWWYARAEVKDGKVVRAS